MRILSALLALLCVGSCSQPDRTNSTSPLELYDSLSSRFAQEASRRDVEVADGRMKIAAGWYQQVFVAHTGIRSAKRWDEGRPLSLLEISTPQDRPLQSDAGDPIPPGLYVARATVDPGNGAGTLDLIDGSGRSVAQMAIDAGSGPGCGGVHLPTCKDITHVSFFHRRCEICIDWDCESGCFQKCLTIPFCRKDDGDLVSVLER